MKLDIETFDKFEACMRDGRLEELPKHELLSIYRNIETAAERLKKSDDWQNLLADYAANLTQTGQIGSSQAIYSPGIDTEEVNVGVGYLEAFHEAGRCLECLEKPCSTGKLQFSDEIIGGCPVLVDIPGFIKLIKEGKIFQAWLKLIETDRLPAITGRVCPQEVQCQLSCSVMIKDEPVEIGRLERFVADYVWENYPEAVRAYIESLRDKYAKGMNTKHHIAVIGSGPAGLTAAIDLVINGYEVTIFESLHVPGGVLAYGIPIFRLPTHVLERELSIAEALGVRFVHNVTVGQSITVHDLFHQGFSAVFVATGAGLPKFLNIPGENLKHVYSANEFLVRVNLMKAYEKNANTPVKVGKKVVVVGGGFTAIDAARWSKRLGAEKVTILYRRTRKEMPARAEEVENAIDEGIALNFLTNPVKILSNQWGEVRSICCVNMELGEPDSSGRRRPVPIAGSEHEIPVDTLITAIGTTPNTIILKTTNELKGTKWGAIEVQDQETGETSMPFTFAGGDAVTGAATVILAMGAGKRAAAAIHQALKQRKSTPLKFDQSLLLVNACSQPYMVMKNQQLVDDVYEIVVQAPVVAKYCQAGQFVMVMKDKSSERIPLTIADWDRERGEITLIYQVVGKGTADLERLNTGDKLFAVSGPIGKPSVIKQVDGRVLMVAGGVGLAAVYPILRAHLKAGNHVHLVYGARNRHLFFWLDKIKDILPHEHIHLSTDDGSLGTKGFVTDVIREKFIETGEISLAVVIGPAVMMREAAKQLLAKDILVVVSLNPVMLDGSAMCGGCKISQKDGKVSADDFACSHGPDRLASRINMDELVSRLTTYKDDEREILLHHINKELQNLFSTYLALEVVSASPRILQQV